MSRMNDYFARIFAKIYRLPFRLFALIVLDSGVRSSPSTNIMYFPEGSSNFVKFETALYFT